VLAPVLAAAAADSGPELRLTFVGDGPDRRRLQGLFAGRETTFTGVLRDGSLATAYADADVLLFTSLTDTVGLVLLEAMAAQLPVVALDTPATRHTLNGYRRAAFVSDRAAPVAWLEAIRTALSSTPTATGDLSDAAAFPYTWRKSTEALVSAYRSLVAEADTPVPSHHADPAEAAR
jgi:glycosyltransferase involved in cell wall biosynthesis